MILSIGHEALPMDNIYDRKMPRPQRKAFVNHN